MLNWRFDGQGAWEAESLLKDDYGPSQWRIVVCDDGTFDVSESDTDLTGKPAHYKFGTLGTLALAKAFCEDLEAKLQAKEPV